MLFWCHAHMFPKFGGAYAPIEELRDLLNFAYVGVSLRSIGRKQI